MAIRLEPSAISGLNAFASKNTFTWCNACGNYGIATGVKTALAELGYAPWQVLLCFDVGCNGNMSDKVDGYRVHGLHGRVLPFAAGAKLANPKLPVIAFGGDGASFSEGIGHLVHAVRSHYPIVFILHNNGNYGLTTGQASSLTPKGEKMNTAPNGIPEQALNSMDFIFSLEPTFVARTWSGNIPQITSIMKSALAHRGFAFIDILQACPTYNHFATHQMLLEKCYDINEEDYDASDLKKARKIAIDTNKRIATGILYQNEKIPHFLEQLEGRKGRTTTVVEEVAITDVSALMKECI